MTKQKTEKLATSSNFSADALITYVMARGLNGRMGIPLCIWGEPGTGKSSEIRAVLKGLGFHVETVILSQREPTEITGTQLAQPEMQEDGSSEMVVKYTMPFWARRVNRKAKQGTPCFVFFDELSTCQPAGQANALRIINEGNAADWELHPTVRSGAAANPPSCAANGHELSPPMSNRMGHFEVKSRDPRQFANWLQSNGGDRYHLNYENSEEEAKLANKRYKELEEKINKRWDYEFSTARAMIATFITRHPSCLQSMPDPDVDDASRAWSSSRTWEAAARLIATARCLDMGERVITQVLSSIVGEESCTAYTGFAKHLDLPDLYEILDGKSKYVVDPGRADVAEVVLNSLASFVTQMTATGTMAPYRLANFWKFLHEQGTVVKDSLVPVLKRIISHDVNITAPNDKNCMACLESLEGITKQISRHKRGK